MAKRCEGCIDEMITAYEFQEAGIDAGLSWEDNGGHCFVFALNKKGNLIIW